MMKFFTTTELSEIWGISARRIALLCNQGRVEGAIKKRENLVDSRRCKKA